MNYKHLHYFWVVAKAGSISRASERLHVTPQTVSGQLVEVRRASSDERIDTIMQRLLTERGIAERPAQDNAGQEGEADHVAASSEAGRARDGRRDAQTP